MQASKEIHGSEALQIITPSIAINGKMKHMSVFRETDAFEHANSSRINTPAIHMLR